MDVVLGPLIQVALIALNLYLWAIIISAVLSWLVAFNVINTSNRFVYMVGDFLHRITEPALRPIRSVVPVMGGVDLSPMVLILLIIFLEGVLGRLAMQAGAF
ncbi:YggT family protein [Caenispirillum salinarum]|uniref:YggT family protein n=1 Tax=Caenispirillum salinarum TaxID=859058 RepID=UPI00384F5970